MPWLDKHTFPRLARSTLNELQQNQHEKASFVCVRVQSPSGLALAPCALSMVDLSGQLRCWITHPWYRKMFLFFIFGTLRMLVRPAMKRLFCLKAKNGLGRFVPSTLPHYYDKHFRLSFYIKLKNVSCEYDRWMVDTQLCKLRHTSDTLVGRACATFQLKDGVCELHLSTIWLLITLYSPASFMVGCSRVFYMYSSWKI